jgi:CubicO group peptidase (beta-lactamase class C family)
MLARWLRILLAVSLAFWLGCHALNAAEIDTEAAKECVRSYLAENRRAAVTIGIIDANGPRVFGFGQLKRDAPESLPNGKTIYQIGSITKVFTTTMLAERIVLGRMKLDDPAQENLPSDLALPKEKDREITLEDLATHYSGLPRLPQLSVVFMLGSSIAQNPYAGTTWEDMPQVLRTVWLSSSIGESYHYSNLGMGLLGQALVHSTKSANYAELVGERIAKPLGLTDTCIVLSEEQSRRLVQGYGFFEQMQPAWDFSSLEGAGALYSTADDMLVFAAANLGLRESNLAPAMQLAQQARPERKWSHGQMGLGWHIQTKESRHVWHNGMTGGYASMLILVPEEKFAVVVLSNVAASVDAVAAGVVEKLAEGQKPVTDGGNN